MDQTVLIVYSHPYEKSFNHAVLEAVVRGVGRAGDVAEVCDLYADGFEPAMSAEELRIYNDGGHVDPLVERYQAQVARADRLVIVCPVWWNDVPAMVRGWLDKVMLVGFSWEATGEGLRGTLQHIRRVDVYTTSTNTTEFTRERLGDSIQRALIDGTFWQLGVAEGTWHNFGGMDGSTEAERAAWLAGVETAQL